MRSATRSLLLLVLAAITLLLAPRPANACDCRRAEGPGDAFTRAAVVFAGTVTAIRHIEEDLYETTFTVEEVFRGKPGKTVVVASRWNGGSCDYAGFTVGTRMLIYAGRSTRLYVSGCSGTRPLAQAAGDLAYLRHAVKSRTATVEGTVTLSGDPRQSASVPRANVEVRARDTAYATRTGGDGTYRLELPPGRYTLDLADPEPGLATGSGVPVELPAIGTWARRDVSVAWNGRIRGKLRDHDGQPVENVLVRALPASDQDPSSFDGRVFPSARTDASGDYEIAVVPEGNYRVAVSVPFDPAFPVPATYYPGVPTRAQARTVKVPRGGLVTNIDFTLRAPERLFTVSGVVARAGKPPAHPGDVVYVVNTAEHRTSQARVTGDDAKFEIEEAAGAVLKLYACAGPLGDGLCTDPITFTLDQDRSFTLTLPEWPPR